MVQQFSNSTRRPVSAAECARSFVRIGSSSVLKKRRQSLIMMPAWNAGPVPGTALSGLSSSIPMTAAAAPATFSMFGSPRLPEKNLQDADADRPKSENKETLYLNIIFLPPSYKSCVIKRYGNHRSLKIMGFKTPFEVFFGKMIRYTVIPLGFIHRS